MSFIRAQRFHSFSSSRQSPRVEPPPYSSDGQLETRYKSYQTCLQWIRATVTFITLTASCAIIGCSASSLVLYSQTHLSTNWSLPLWPTHVDLRPTHAALGCGIGVAVLSLFYLAAALVPLPQPKLRLLNILSSIFSFIGLFVALFTVIFTTQINANRSTGTSVSSGTLMSWTCKWQAFENVAPTNFGKICTEGIVSIDLVILLVIIEAVAVGVAAWGWWVEMKTRKGTMQEQEDRKLERGSP